MSYQVRLVIESGPWQGKAYRFLTHDTLIFGRDVQSCHVSLPDDGYISRNHFLMELNPPAVWIRDLGSRNGTFLNDVKIAVATSDGQNSEAGVRLKHGDLVRVGKTTFRILVELQPGQTAGNQEDQQEGNTDSAGVDSKFRPTVRMMERLCERCGAAVAVISNVDCDDDSVVCRHCRPTVQKLAGQSHRQKSETKSQLPVITGYQLLRRIGQGGMGTVYHARRESDQQDVAIKVLVGEGGVCSKSQSSFLRECEILKQLVHCHIVQFLQAGVSGERVYLAMEYCAGQSLKALYTQRKEPIPCKKLTPLFVPLLKAIEYAHRRGFVHRDLKPENILLEKSEEPFIPKLADFGLAKNYHQAGLSGMTVTGSFAGTYDFMPREQLTNYKYLNPVSDLWSMAATYYFLATGCYPRTRRPGMDAIQVILSQDAVPIRSRNSEIPASVAQVIDRALQTEPEKRFGSAEEMLQALQ